MSKETAFHPRLKALTDQWMDLFGYWAPSVVTDTLGEYRAVRESAGLMDFSMLRKYDIEGRGALEGVNRLVTRDVAKLKPGHIAYGALCNEQGKMVDDCTVLVRSEDRLRFCGANDKDREFLEHAVKGSGAKVRDITDDIGHLCVQGPKSREWLQDLTDRDLSRDVFPYYTFKDEVVIAGIPAFMTRLGYTAELGYELWIDRDRALECWDRLIEALEPKGMKVVGMTALDLLRIEGGFIIGGVEYNETVSPYECGLGWAVNFDKGEFQGRAAVEKDRQATPVRLTSVVLESGGDAATGAALHVKGAEVGTVTQAISSPFLGGTTLGLAKIRKDLAVAGTAVSAQVGGESVGGEVVRHPAYEPERKKVKS
ncbi:MAG TPA: aminomethyltransferase family protein [Candidatus Dormibacteraeota bacterium]|nr:aminomethyltransferase family protein [Candidatus Dormibacteraeota bacterium]